jgi:4-hydroxybenzoate polyprenyltransferase
MQALLYLVFFYPLALTHLGLNDLADYENDKARKLATIPVLYGASGSVRWIALWSVAHLLASAAFVTVFDSPARYGLLGGLLLLAVANYKVLRKQTPEAAAGSLPFFHAALFVYLLSIFLDFALA